MFLSGGGGGGAGLSLTLSRGLEFFFTLSRGAGVISYTVQSRGAYLLHFPGGLGLSLTLSRGGWGLSHTLSYTGNMMFFGCRSSCADFFFASEWLALDSEGSLQLFTAFSRDQEHKVYVQHKITEHGELVWRWLSGQQAYIFIAG